MGRRQRNRLQWIEPLRSAPPPPAIFAGRERLRVVRRLAQAMNAWVSSAFEQEGDMRAAIRSQLCLQGHAWKTADHEAAGLVAQALKLRGAVRPNWDEGQREYTRVDGFCIQCGGPVELGETTRRGRYCSVKCARAARIMCQGEGRQLIGASLKNAGLTIKRESFERVECQVCTKPFLPYGADARRGKYCSFACAGIARRKLEPIPCRHCGTSFQPRRSQQIYCSPECQGHERRQLDERQCKQCQQPFRPTTAQRIYCGMECRNKAMLIHMERKCVQCGQKFKPRGNDQILCGIRCRDEKKRQHALASCLRCSTAFVGKTAGTRFCSRLCYDEEMKDQSRRALCAWCGVPFEARRKTSRFCSDSHRAMDGQQRRKNNLKRPTDNVIYLTVNDFDRVFRGRSAEPETVTDIFDKLFG
jgi:hypothetical protein